MLTPLLVALMFALIVGVMLAFVLAARQLGRHVPRDAAHETEVRAWGFKLYHRVTPPGTSKSPPSASET